MNCTDELGLCITQGDEKTYNLHFKNDVGDIDITGATVTMTVKRSKTGAAIITKSVTSHTTPLEGKTSITLTPADTDIELGHYFYDIQIHGGSLPKKTVLKGTLTITWQITED